jgi:hypothetical protein
MAWKNVVCCVTYGLMAVRCQKFSYSYLLRNLPMNSLVNWLDFLCNLFCMCCLLNMCLITSLFLLHFQEKMWKVHEASTVNYCVGILQNMSSKWQRVVTTNASFSKVLLEHSQSSHLLLGFITIIGWIILWDLPDCNPSMDQFLIPSSREPYITDWWFSV